MAGSIKFDYDKKNDITIATPHWHIVDENDCEVWYKQWIDYLKFSSRKMDFIMVLDDFKVDSAIASVWGEYRAKINKEYIRHGYRVNPELSVSIYIKTSGIRYNAASSEAASIEDAIEAINAARAAENK
ncbi:MAG: hypothetical protein JXX29_04275 [Deltaproteobacteria bacterium]|nr:hypothetical protein [Deltaproteobacteria bacterium]MBN2670861.1 hypothetical protein [Deltaproteobacteria bacterium]